MEPLRFNDIIGPVMVGPSSSHTAGALRIARMARRLMGGQPARVTFTLYGSFAHTGRGHGTDKALVAGMLGYTTDDLRIRDSFALAREAGMDVRVEFNEEVQTEHPNTVDIFAVGADGHELRLRGVSIGGGACAVRNIDGIDVDIMGDATSLVVQQDDAPGVLAHIAGCLARAGVNIATTRMYRERRGSAAYTVMEIDGDMGEETLAAIRDFPSIREVRVVPASRAGKQESAPAAPEEVEAAERLFNELEFTTGAQLLERCAERGLSIGRLYEQRECALRAFSGEITAESAARGLREYADYVLQVMRASAAEPVERPQRSMGGLIGGEACAIAGAGADASTGAAACACGGAGAAGLDDGGIRLYRDICASKAGKAEKAVAADAEAAPLLVDPLTQQLMAKAMAVLETNASMGRIVAAPTAGSAGVLPAVLLALAEKLGYSDDDLVQALYCAAAVGQLVATNSTVSGAEGGCQAEIGTACGMAAAAAVELAGGTPAQALDAAANAFMCLMGLVCDPVRGLVEVPCQKRNASAAATAVVCAQMARLGIANLVSFDEAVDALDAVGRTLPFELRESALGGIAAAPSACGACAAPCR